MESENKQLIIALLILATICGVVFAALYFFGGPGITTPIEENKTKNDTCSGDNCAFQDISTPTEKPKFSNCTQEPVICDDQRTVKYIIETCYYVNGSLESNNTVFSQDCDPNVKSNVTFTVIDPIVGGLESKNVSTNITIKVGDKI